MKTYFNKGFLLLLMHIPFCLAAQNVGIGTTNPAYKLHVITGTGFGITHEANGVQIATYIDANGGWIGTYSNHPFFFYTNNSTAQMAILTNGNVGIGVTNAAQKLDVGGRMRIRQGILNNIFTTPGIWMDDYRNGDNRIFLGMQDSIRMGIWGEGSGGQGAGWGFNFNARTGNVGINALPTSSRLEVGGELKATSIKTDDISYNSPKTHYLSIPPSAFTVTVNYNPANPVTWYYEEDNYVGTDVPYSQFAAPVILPDGATVTGMTIYYIDTSPDKDVVVKLRKRIHSSAQYFLMATAQSSGSSGDGETTTNAIAFAQINNELNVHSLLFTGTSGTAVPELKLKSVRIAYTVPAPQ